MIRLAIENIEKSSTWLKQIYNIFKPSEIAILDQFSTLKKDNNVILQEISREGKYYMADLINIEYFECCCVWRVLMLKVLLKRQTSNKLLRIIWNYLELFGIFWIVKYFRNTDTCLNLDKQAQIWTVQTCTNLSEFRMSPNMSIDLEI